MFIFYLTIKNHLRITSLFFLKLWAETRFVKSASLFLLNISKSNPKSIGFYSEETFILLLPVNLLISSGMCST